LVSGVSNLTKAGFARIAPPVKMQKIRTQKAVIARKA
jgi:hypothetical protein